MSSYPLYPTRQIIDLNGSWQFCFFEKKRLEEVELSAVCFNDIMIVPGTFDTTPQYRFKRGTAIYRRQFRLRADACRAVLKIGAVGLRGKFFIDDQLVGGTALPYSPVEFETASLSSGYHTITVVIDNTFDKNSLGDAGKMKLFLPYYDFYAFGGFYRGVEIHLLNDTSLERVQVHTRNIETGEVNLRFLFSGNTHGNHDVSFRFDTEETFRNATVANGDTISCRVPNFKLWSTQTPNLHSLEVKCNGDIIIERFGIRTISAGKKEILLNGKPIFLKGFNRHESHAEFGPAIPEAVMIEDLQHMRNLNCNFVRGAHYTQDPRFLDLCDEFGILVWEESLGWGNNCEQVSELAFQELAEEQSRYMVRDGINHPSIIIWGFLNEIHSFSKEALNICRTLKKAIKEEDNSRLVTFACCRLFDDICQKEMDILAFNAYPAWINTDGIGENLDEEVSSFIGKVIEYFRNNGSKDKPMIASEIGCCAIYGERDETASQWSEEFQAEYLKAVLNAINEYNSQICGIAIWQLNDAMSYHRCGANLRVKPLALNLAGIFDQFRRKKISADVVKEYFKEM